MSRENTGKRRVAAFIFDLDGTLVDSGRDIAGSANFVRAHFDLPELPPATIHRYVGDGVARLLVRSLGHDAATGRTGPAGLPVPAQKLEEGLRVFAGHYADHLLDRTVPYPGVVEALERLGGTPLYLATNKPRAFTDAILRGLRLTGVFRRIVAGDEAPERKPDPSHLAACLDDPPPDPAGVVVVGDSPNDINAARALGAVSVGCTYGLVQPEVVRSARPDHLIDSIGELVDLFPANAG